LPRSAERGPLPRRLRRAVVAVALAAGAAALVLGGRGARLASLARSPETDVKEALARLGRVSGLEAGPARVDLSRLALADVAVLAEGGRARVLAIVDADGRARFADQAPSLAYVGREAFSVERCEAGWCPAPDAFPALRGVVAALAGAPRPAGARVVAWQVRVERETASAGEDDEVPEGGAARRLRLTFTLRRDGETWRLAPP
jgi:hypothetical protein